MWSIVEGSLEVKFPKKNGQIKQQRWKSQRRERKKEDQRGERKKREDQRRSEGVSRKMIQARQKGRQVAKHCVFSNELGLRGSKSRIAKAAGTKPSGKMRDQILHAAVAQYTCGVISKVLYPDSDEKHFHCVFTGLRLLNSITPTNRKYEKIHVES